MTVPRADLEGWLDAWESCIRSGDYARGRALFDPGVVAFGTRRSVATGLDDLVEHQWRQVWPRIVDFRFDRDSLWIECDGEDLAVLMVRWATRAQQASGSVFHRPGRATIVLRRAPPEGWRAIHTHFSLEPGTPQELHAPPLSDASASR